MFVRRKDFFALFAAMMILLTCRAAAQKLPEIRYENLQSKYDKVLDPEGKLSAFAVTNLPPSGSDSYVQSVNNLRTKLI